MIILSILSLHAQFSEIKLSSLASHKESRCRVLPSTLHLTQPPLYQGFVFVYAGMRQVNLQLF
jgi:hypothetical protein